MKTATVVLSALTMMLMACNNETKDSVEQADSANRARLDSPGTTQPITTDEETSSFLVKAANGGMTEVQLGQVAQQKGTHQKVKDFGAMMVHDHSAVNEQVKTMAAQRNVTLPSAVSDENQKDITDLEKKSGNDFDRAYIKHMVAAHQSTIDMYESALNKINDTEVKTFINNALPKVKSHLDSAKAIQKTLR